MTRTDEFIDDNLSYFRVLARVDEQSVQINYRFNCEDYSTAIAARFREHKPFILANEIHQVCYFPNFKIIVDCACNVIIYNFNWTSALYTKSKKLYKENGEEVKYRLIGENYILTNPQTLKQYEDFKYYSSYPYIVNHISKINEYYSTKASKAVTLERKVHRL